MTLPRARLINFIDLFHVLGLFEQGKFHRNKLKKMYPFPFRVITFVLQVFVYLSPF
jgi:hypothetical protein